MAESEKTAPAWPSHQGLPVRGYVGQSNQNVDMVNVNKDIEERVLRRCDDMRQFVEFDQRWISIAFTHFQEGFMALNRAIFQPQRISLPDDEPKDSD